jgi:hypothetical protein
MKVLFAYILDKEDSNDGTAGYESVWVSEVEGGYVVDNIPFFARGIAWGDIITVEEDEGAYYFEDLVEASGHSTVQVIFFDLSAMDEAKDILVKMGCDWEGMKHDVPLLAVDVPPSIDYGVVKEYLENGKSAGSWDYREACLGWK